MTFRASFTRIPYESVNELLTTALTVVLGFVVFVFGQIAQRFFIEPIQEQKRVIREIAFAVLFYGNVGKFATPELRQEALETLRKLSGQLHATLWTVPRHRLFESLGIELPAIGHGRREGRPSQR